MRELTKTMTSFSWAMSLFGAKQMLNMMNPAQAARAFESITRATEGQLDEGLRSAFRTGDRLQRSIVDATFSLLSGAGLADPATWTGATRRAMDCVTEAAGGEKGPRPGATGARPTGTGPSGAESSTQTGWGPVPD